MSSSKPPVWFWIVSVVALLWNMLGVMAFVGQMMMTPDMLAQLPEAQRVQIEARPMWATIAFGIAVFGGAIGCALLLIRSRLAKGALLASALAVFMQMGQAASAGNFADAGPGGMAMAAMIIGVAALLVWLAAAATRKGWLR
ncbi:MAG: hypothetical protein H7A20_00100 [Rhodanobacteraceae bacterium]|nr:hypothetical protein [Rhodanobacteraceae bacterium]HPF74040.1 hypothetical protein [Xanthomonadaceae bacterium]HRX99778.1 hypothetical protein [Xanthomonadaceae bacterium]